MRRGWLFRRLFFWLGEHRWGFVACAPLFAL